MFVFLSKFIPPLIYPLGLAILLLLISLFLQKRPRFQKALVTCAMIILLLGSNRWVAVTLARSLEWQYLPQGEIPSADCIVVLGGSTDPAEPPRPTVELNGAADRVFYTALLYHQGKAPVILSSGGNISWLDSRSSTPAEEMAIILTQLGVPEEAILKQNRSQNTYEDALYSAAILKEKGFSRVILVTSAMHMPRSVALFRKQGIEVIPAPADFSVTETSWGQLIHADFPGLIVSLLPNVGNLSLTTNALKEYIGILAYHLRGWL